MSAGVGGGAPFFLPLGTKPLVFGEGHITSLPPSVSVTTTGFTASAVRSTFPCNAFMPAAGFGVGPAAAVSFLRSFQYARYRAATSGEWMMMQLLFWVQRPEAVQLVLPVSTDWGFPLAST